MMLHLLPNYLLQSPATYIILISITVVSTIGFYNQKVFGALMLHPKSIIQEKAYYRFFTADFVHVDVTHLVLNDITIYVFCSDLEESLNKRSMFGSFEMIFIYLFSMLTANIITTIIHRKDAFYSGAGASGSVMGCLFSFMILEPFGYAVNIAFLGGIPNVYVVLVYITGLIFYKKRRKDEAINHELHFYGAAGGLLGTLLLYLAIL